MHKMFWIGILGIIAMTGNTSAQVPSECGGGYLGYSSCRFACQSGDFIAISGSPYFADSYISVRASCGGVSVFCEGSDFCTAQSEKTVALDDENGSCQSTALEPCDLDPEHLCQGHGIYRCASVTPEEATELKVSGCG